MIFISSLSLVSDNAKELKIWETCEAKRRAYLLLVVTNSELLWVSGASILISFCLY
jgi:hypothetical protein